jgi:hypothetical protein
MPALKPVFKCRSSQPLPPNLNHFNSSHRDGQLTSQMGVDRVEAYANTIIYFPDPWVLGQSPTNETVQVYGMNENGANVSLSFFGECLNVANNLSNLVQDSRKSLTLSIIQELELEFLGPQ